jgi:hypothetical protein
MKKGGWLFSGGAMTKSRGIGRGGTRLGAGRKAGGTNENRRELAKALDTRRALSPLAFMLSIVDDMAQPIAMRLLATRYSAPYVQPSFSGSANCRC